MLLQVSPDTLDENFLAEILGHHAEDTGSLGVRDAVKNLVDLSHPLHWHLDRVTAPQTVQVQGGGQIIDNVILPHLPVRVELIHRVPAHPSSKTFVEPQTLPEIHGDQVAEPLVGKFVLDDLSNTLFPVDGGGFGVVEQVDDTVGDQTPVLHGAGREVGNGNHVHLGERVVDAECLLVECEGPRGDVKGEIGVLLVSGSGVHTDGKTEGIGLLVFKVTDNECQQLDSVSPITPSQTIAPTDGRLT